jgi:hypothetical protein
VVAAGEEVEGNRDVSEVATSSVRNCQHTLHYHSLNSYKPQVSVPSRHLMHYKEIICFLTIVWSVTIAAR